MVHCFTYETAGKKHPAKTRGFGVVNQEIIWETFDSLFKTVHRQGRRVEELEARVIDLERCLNERAAVTEPKAPRTVTEMPAERAA
jgi:hypothetical protein